MYGLCKGLGNLQSSVCSFRPLREPRRVAQQVPGFSFPGGTMLLGDGETCSVFCSSRLNVVPPGFAF